MRSRCMRTLYQKPDQPRSPRGHPARAGRQKAMLASDALAPARASETLPSRTLQNGPGTFADVQFRCAVSTKPHQHSWRVNPKKRGNFASHFQSFITLQPLQSLNKKYSVISLTIRAFFTVNALTFKKELLSHGGRPFPHAAPREFQYKIRGILPGTNCCLRRKKGRAIKKILQISTPQAHDAMALIRGQQSFMTI